MLKKYLRLHNQQMIDNINLHVKYAHAFRWIPYPLNIAKRKFKAMREYHREPLLLTWVHFNLFDK